VVLILISQRRDEEAAAVLEQALDRKVRTGAGDADQAVTLLNLALVRRSQLRFDDALDLYQRSYRLLKSGYGPAHPEIGRPLNGLGRLAFETGALEQARDYFEQALSVYAAAFGYEHREAIRVSNNLSLAELELGHTERALTRQTETLARAERALGTDDAMTLEALANCGAILVESRRESEALAPLERALRGFERLLGPDHPSLSVSLTVLGRAHLGMLPDEVPLLVAERPRDMNRALALDVSDDLRHRVLRRDRDHDVHVVEHQMPLLDGGLPLLRKRSEDRPKVTTKLAVERLASVLRDEDHMILAFPLCVA
jgi:tetratricopeptide (TPR) repeat protein